MFTVVMGSLIVVIVSWVCAYAQTHQTVHNKYVQLTVYQLNFNIAVFKQEMKNSWNKNINRLNITINKTEKSWNQKYCWRSYSKCSREKSKWKNLKERLRDMEDKKRTGIY